MLFSLTRFQHSCVGEKGTSKDPISNPVLDEGCGLLLYENKGWGYNKLRKTIDYKQWKEGC